jgi:uncharacterized protein YihD (DUF1040 family)
MKDKKKLLELIEMQQRLKTVSVYKQAIKEVADTIYKYDVSKSIRPAIIPVDIFSN